MSTVRATFDQLNIVSGNVSASVDFYRRLGVEIPEGRLGRSKTGIHHVSAIAAEKDAANLEIDSVAFAQVWNAGWNGRNDLKGRVVVGFSVPSRAVVDEIYAELTGVGYGALQAPCDAFWGARYAVVEDPDGIAVGLMSPISPELKSQPPEI